MTTHTIDLEHKALTMTDNLNAKILRFVAYDLGRHVTLMLTFQPPQLGILYKDTFPLCWGMDFLLVLFSSFVYLSFIPSEIVEMGSTGTAIAEVRYTANTVFFLPQVYFMHFTIWATTNNFYRSIVIGAH